MENFKTSEERAIIGKQNEQATISILKPSNAFVGASWMVFVIGVVSYCVGLSNAEMQLNEKGYYFTLLLFGLFSVISVQKNVRDKMEQIPVSDIYYGLSWFSALASLTLLVIGLWNADLELSEKGFFGMAYLVGLFAAITVQKNTRDLKVSESNN
ncbi:membrane protein [Flavobacterium cauense R2A-7]|nr:membrane protein [Flavobacterium cauense R2A-7]